jgi:Tol biopolymer transport system component
MKSDEIRFLLIAFMLSLLLWSCNEEKIDPDKRVIPAYIHTSRQTNSIQINFDLPGIAYSKTSFIYMPNTIFANRYDLFLSKGDTLDFQFLSEVHLEDNFFLYPENESGMDYFFRLKCSIKGANPVFSNIAWVKGGQNSDIMKLFDIPDGLAFELGDISQDGKNLLYSKGGNVISYNMDTEIENLKIGAARRPKFSPDEKFVLFTSNFGDFSTPWPSNLGILDMAINETQQLTTGINEVQNPLFSIDGKSMYYWNTPYQQTESFVEYNLETKEARTLISPDRELYIQVPLSLSANGALISFEARNEQSNVGIYTLDLKTLTIEQIEQTLWSEYSASFSPDGNYLAFLSNRSGYDELWVKNLSTTEIYQLTGFSGLYPLKGTLLWNAESSKIIFRAYMEESYGLYTIDYIP